MFQARLQALTIARTTPMPSLQAKRAQLAIQVSQTTPQLLESNTTKLILMVCKILFILKIGKSHKKSLEVNPNARAEMLVKNYESPRRLLNFRQEKDKDGSLDRASMKTKDFKDLLYRGAVTPSGHLHASIMEKLLENKYRK